MYLPLQILLAAGLIVALALLWVGCRLLKLAPPPWKLPLAAIVSLPLVSAVKLAPVPVRYHSILSALDKLLLVYAAIALLLWLLLEFPASLGLWRKPPSVFIQLLALGTGVLATIVVLQQFAKLDLVALATTSAILTAVVGLAIQEPLKDLLAGLELQLEDHFQLGDFLNVGDRAKGIVVGSTLMNTHLVTFQGDTVLVPNADVVQSILRRYRNEQPVANHFSIGLDYSLPPARARALLLPILRHHTRVLPEPPPQVLVGAYADSSITYELVVWHIDARELPKMQIRGELLEQIWYALAREGHSIPFPVRELRPKRDPHPDPEDPLHADTHQRLQILSRNALFRGLDHEQLAGLAPLTRCLRFGPGETVVQEGDQGDAMFQVVSGCVEVVKQSAAGDVVSVAELGVGEIFGEMTLFTDVPRQATVQTRKECVLLEVSRKDLVPLIEADPHVLEGIAVLISRRRAQLEKLDQDSARQQGASVLQRMRQLFDSLSS